MRSRSRLEIYLGLMEEASKNSDTTRLRKDPDLSSSDAERHLGFLVSQGFLRVAERDNSGAKYELTSKGSEVLDALRGIGQPDQLTVKQR